MAWRGGPHSTASSSKFSRHNAARKILINEGAKVSGGDSSDALIGFKPRGPSIIYDCCNWGWLNFNSNRDRMTPSFRSRRRSG